MSIRSLPSLLDRDLHWLGRVRDIGDHDAAVFHAARVLERLTEKAIERLTFEPSANVFSRLGTLASFGKLSKSMVYFAHAVRRLGNSVRHVRAEVGEAESELAAALAPRLVRWFMGMVEAEDRQEVESLAEVLARHSRALATSLGPELERIERVADDSGEKTDALRAVDAARAASSPVFGAIEADILIDRGNPEEACARATASLGRFPDDLRLRQLLALAYSRMAVQAKRTPAEKTDLLKEALGTLEPLYAESRDDEETAGILAGTYRRTGRLAEARQVYLDAWRAFRNPYHGVNAATTTLFLGDLPRAERLAREVRAHFSKAREKAPAGSSVLPYGSRRGPAEGTRVLFFDYWDTVSWAEAELVAGEVDVARRLYSAAMAENLAQGNRGAVDVTRAQLAQILDVKGIAGSPDDFLRLRLGVTGHRRLPDPERVRRAVEQVLDRLGSRSFVVLSPVAEGADRIVAEAVLARPGCDLEAVLPLERDDYERDFETEDSKAVFRRLLARAARVVSLPPAGDRNAAYEAVGRTVAARADVVVAIWNGEPAAGRGGTAEIVEYARSVGKPLVWIRSTDPGQVVWEGF